MKNLNDIRKTAQIVYDCGHELYHLECLRREQGDDGAIDKLRVHYQREDQLSPADAAIRAGQFIKDVDALKQRKFNFAEMRKPAKNPSGTGDFDGLVPSLS